MLKKTFFSYALLLCLIILVSCNKQDTPQKDKDLMEAIRTGDLTEITRLLKAGANIHTKDQHGNTPLHIAALAGNISKIELLIKNGSRINATDDNGETPLHEAAMNGHIKVAELLISKGANVNAKNKQGKTPIFPAAQSGNLDLVKFLVSKGATIQTTGYTPLHDALDNSFLQLQPDNNLAEMVEYFLSKGVDVNAKDDYMITPLYLAARCVNSEIINLLIKKGAQIDMRTKGGETPLFRAAMAGNKGAAEVLLNNGANVNNRNDANETPLHFALRSNNMVSFATMKDRFEVVELLIANGADVNACDNRKYTPLFEAVDLGLFYKLPKMTPELKKHYKKLLQALLDKGADSNFQDRSGRTPIKLAEGEPEIIELLIKYGAKQ
jgi:ankyrin repeat protein